MDDKVLSSVGDLELADQPGGASPIQGVGEEMTRDEREMKFYGKKSQLKVRIPNDPAPECVETDEEQRRFGFLSIVGFSCSLLATWEVMLA
jgi:choline transport protein